MSEEKREIEVQSREKETQKPRVRDKNREAERQEIQEDKMQKGR